MNPPQTDSAPEAPTTVLPPVRDGIYMNEPIAVTLPAFAWIAYVSAYQSTDFGNPYAQQIAMEAERMLFTEEFIAEREARFRAMQEAERQMHAQVAQGQAGGFAVLGRPSFVPRDQHGENDLPVASSDERNDSPYL